MIDYVKALAAAIGPSQATKERPSIALNKTSSSITALGDFSPEQAQESKDNETQVNDSLEEGYDDYQDLEPPEEDLYEPAEKEKGDPIIDTEDDFSDFINR